MNQRLRILHLEDEPDYSALVKALFQKEGLEAEVFAASTREEFEAALERGSYDMILADYRLPDYDGLEALALVKKKCPETPFLILSGTIGEQAAIESLKSGATDYVLKLWPERLVAAVKRAAQESAERTERRIAETQLVRREEALRQSEHQYQLIFEGSPTPMWVFDQETLRFLEVNDAALQHYGYTREEFLALTLKEIRPPEDVPYLLEYLQQVVNKGPGKLGYAGVWRHRKKDASVIEVEIRWSPIIFHGRPAGLGIANDVTERRRIEHRDAVLSQLGQSLSSATSPAEAAQIIKAVADELFSWDAFTLDLYSGERNRIYPTLNVDTNREGKRFDIPVNGVGREPSKMARRIIEKGGELILRDPPLAMPGDTIPIGDTERASASLAVVPIRNRTKVNGVLSIQSYKFKAYGPQDLAALQMLADHCGGALERIRTEQALNEVRNQLRQSQKLEAIGQLAGGVAHDFNNILTVIHGHASLMKESFSPESPATRSAHQIVQAAERAAALTRQLLAFSRRQVIQLRRVDLNDVVTNMTKMLGRILGEDIAVKLHYAPQPACFQGEATMIEQVVLNLAVNSRDAMPRGGLLTIRISVVEVKEGERTEEGAGRFVCLTVTDTGCGIPPENLPRIFEPFFTTKEVGKGTGLGLATVYGIVKQHQGWIEVESQPGNGATFRVYLPQAAEGSSTSDTATAENAVRGGSETILVVEDETPVRELVCDFLAGRGYKILQAESGLKALELWKDCKEKVDLVLTDLVMPDQLNGRELAEKLWTEKPKLKVIFTSGYSAEIVGKDFVVRPGLSYLQKPYQPHELAVAVRERLDAVS
jgi:PAS domain S-box-containing protein